MLEILTALFPPWFYEALGGGQKWPLPDEDLGLIEEKGFTMTNKDQEIARLKSKVERLGQLVSAIKAHEERIIDDHIRVYMSAKPFPNQRERMLADRHYYQLILKYEAAYEPKEALCSSNSLPPYSPLGFTKHLEEASNGPSPMKN